MTDGLTNTTNFTQELEKTRQEQLKAIRKARRELEKDSIDDESQKEEFKALKQIRKSLKLYPPKVKQDGKVETTQEYKARVRKELEAEKNQLDENQVTLSEKEDTLKRQETVLSEVQNNLETIPREGLSQAGFSDGEIENLQSREKRIAEQEKLQKQADALKGIDTNDPSNIDIKSLQEAGFSQEEAQNIKNELEIDKTHYQKLNDDINKKLSALEAITNAENKKLKEAGLNPEDLKTEQAITEKLKAIKEQKENLTKVQEALEARQEEVEKLQKIQDTPETPDTPDTNGSNNDSNLQTPPDSDGGCQGRNCGKQARRGIFKNKASIMVVAATELAALQIDYSQFLS